MSTCPALCERDTDSPGAYDVETLSMVSSLPICGRCGYTGVAECRLGVDAEIGIDRSLLLEFFLDRPLGSAISLLKEDVPVTPAAPHAPRSGEGETVESPLKSCVAVPVRFW